MRMVLYGDTQLMNASSVEFLFHKGGSRHCVGADLLKMHVHVIITRS